MYILKKVNLLIEAVCQHNVALTKHQECAYVDASCHSRPVSPLVVGTLNQLEAGISPVDSLRDQIHRDAVRCGYLHRNDVAVAAAVHVGTFHFWIAPSICEKHEPADAEMS